HLAEQQEDYSRNPSRLAAGKRSRARATGISGLADEFLSLRANAVFYGRQFTLHDIGRIGTISRTQGPRASEGFYWASPGCSEPLNRSASARSRRAAACGPSSRDRKSTRLNSSHGSSSYAVFCLK